MFAIRDTLSDTAQCQLLARQWKTLHHVTLSDTAQCQLLARQWETLNHEEPPNLYSSPTFFISWDGMRLRPLVRFEVFTTVTMKNAVFRDVTQRGSCMN
jgi:hypothetical protein